MSKAIKLVSQSKCYGGFQCVYEHERLVIFQFYYCNDFIEEFADFILIALGKKFVSEFKFL